MELSHYVQLIAGIALAVTAFVAAYAAPARMVMALLLVIAPFEVINSQFGTSSTGLVYLVALALWLRNGINRFPLLWPVLGILLAYAISLAMANVRALDHVLYIVRILPGFLLFYIAYNYVRESRGAVGFINILLVINVLVLVVCTLQLVGGAQQVVLFGINEFALMENRTAQGRLSGPFGAEFTSEYLALASLLLAYLLMNKGLGRRWPVWLRWGLLAGNLGFMVATGSRGGILVLLVGLVWGAFLFRRELGAGRTLGFLLGAALVASVMSALIVQFTDYNVLFERLGGTEIKGGIIDSRSVTWPVAWEAIKERPLLGYGPRLRLHEDLVYPIPGHKPIPYPHSLPLFLLYTLGVVGLIAYTIFFALLLGRFYRGSRARPPNESSGLAKLGFILLVLFLLDEIKIEFLRFIQSDYQAIIFSLFGGLLAMADKARTSVNHVRPEVVARRRLLNSTGARQEM